MNAPYLTNALKPSTEPWLRLGTSLGRLATALLGKQPTSVTVVTIGAGVKTYGSFVLPGVLVGALEGGGVNMVNALKKAKGMGVSTSCERKEEDQERYSARGAQGEPFFKPSLSLPPSSFYLLTSTASLL